jgi:hypothetical protein
MSRWGCARSIGSCSTPGYRSFRAPAAWSGLCRTAASRFPRRRCWAKTASATSRRSAQFAVANGIPIVRFGRRESKQEVARPYLERAEREGRFGCVMFGVCQERTLVWRGWRKGGSDARPYFEYARRAAVPNHYYLYLRDPDWGAAFWKSCADAPYGVPSGSTATSGRSGRPRRPRSPSRRSTTASERAPTPRGPAGALRPARPRPALALLPPLGEAAALPAHRPGSGPLLPLRPRLPPARALRHPRLRPPPGREGLVRADAARPAHARAPRPGSRSSSRARSPRRPRAASGRRSSTAASSPRSPSTTSAPRSSSTSSRAGRSGTETTINDPYDFDIGRRLTRDNWHALLTLGHQTNERLLEAQLQACACA